MVDDDFGSFGLKLLSLYDFESIFKSFSERFNFSGTFISSGTKLMVG